MQAVVRDPSSLDLHDPRLSVERGDVLDAKTLDVRGELVISGIGARSRNAGRIASEGTTNIVAAMKRTGVKRIVSISAAPLGEGESGFQRFLYAVLWRAFREVYEDLRRMEAVLASGEVDWTVMRPPRLTNGALVGRYRTAIDRVVGNTISRADLAREMLEAAGNPATIGHTVGIGY